MNLRKKLALVAFIAGMSAPAFAAYTITRTDGGNNTSLVQGREYEYIISNTNTPTRFEDVIIELNNSNFDILVPPGVQTGPNKYAVDSAGQLIISIRFHVPASFSMTVKNSQDANNKGTLNSIAVQRYPVTFSITPSNPTVNANVPFTIDVTALDTNGVVVTSYEDPVQITDSQLGQLVGFINGSDFSNGTAHNVSVNVKAGDLNNQFRLTLTGTQQYFNPALPAPSLSANPQLITGLLNLTPGAFSKLVLLFPGETLSPGTGKVGAPTSQQSGVPVSLVEVRRVDTFYNPILANPNPATSVEFTSSRGGVDNPPFPFTMSMTGPLLSITSAMNQIFFGGSGSAVVKATPDGDSSKEDSSLIPVSAGAAETYTIETPGVAPGSTITTDSIILVRVRAFDQNGQPLTTLFGQVPGAELRAKLGSGQENRNWVDTNEPTLNPDNVVSFSAGVATMNLVVTKFGSDVQLHYVTPNREAFSNTFNVDVGAPNKVHFTIRGIAPNPTQGETWTPGTFPGNSGTPPTVKVGQEVVVEARITDKRWNLISGGGSSYTMQITNNLPQHFIEARHVSLAGPTYQFPNNGEFSYNSDSAFDKSFRVKYRTAGPSALVTAPRFAGTVSLGTFLSSTATVNPEAYSKLVVAAPGETLRPGIDTESDGKTGSPTAQQAGVQFNSTVYATDLYFNPIINSPFPTVNFTLTPSLANSFVSGSLPSAMQSGSKNFSITLASGTDVRVFDNTSGGINQTTSIPIINGPLDHFRMVLNALGAKETGVPFSVTITAEDQFNNTVVNFTNTVTLTPNTGSTTMSPTSAGLVNGTFTGNLTMFAATTTARVQMSFNSTISQSPTFIVNVNSQGYKRLLLLLPGEIQAPGTTLGKTGSPTPVTVGLVTIVRVLATDLYYNPLDTAGTVNLTSNHLSQFGSAQGNFVNVDGHGEYSTTLILKNATAHTIIARDVNNDATVSRSTSVITGQGGGYRKIQILAPGESNDPDQTTGKTGTPTAQKVATPFTVTMLTVDDFFNPTSFTGGDTNLTSNITSTIFNPPNNTGANPRPFTNGSATRSVIVGQQGTVNVSVIDSLNLTKAGSSVDVQVNPGPTYVFTTPASATAGQAFPSITIRLEENGVPVAGYNQSIFLTADLVSGGAGSGAFNADGSPREYVMNNGAVTITDLTYAHVENIKLHLTDSFARVAFSNAIDVVPSGLKYQVTVPSNSVVAGPPATFQVKVELLEQNTNTLVKNHDHTVDVALVSAVNATTDGSYPTISANLSQGVATFSQSYTKAESILVKISENAGAGDPGFVIPSKNSNNVNVVADGYKKLLILAPGEVHVAGVPSATGKTGTLSSRLKGVPFLVQIRGVDQYWNVANSFSGGVIALDSDDVPASLGATNPANQNAALVNGESASFISLNNPGNVKVTVRDTSNSGIGVQSVILTVGGLYYQVTGTPNVQLTGANATFSFNVTLYDSNTNQPVTSANHSIAISALSVNPTTAAATGTLGVTNAQLANGTVGITNQSYSIAEDIKLLITDNLGNSGTSPLIQFVPRKIRYDFTVPADAEVNKIFHILIKAIDEDTGTQAKNINRTNQLQAFSVVNGSTATGTFSPGTVLISQGAADVSATYNKAELISFIMTDNTPSNQPGAPTQPSFASQGAVNVHPGLLAIVDGITDFTMQSNETKSFTLVAKDINGNLIANQTLNIEVNSIQFPGQLSLNGQVNSVSQKTNGQGELALIVKPNVDLNGPVELIIRDGDHVGGFSKLININAQGLTRGPGRAVGLGDNKIPLGSPYFLNVTLVGENGGTVRTFYRIDGGSYTVYDPARGIEGLNETRRYQIDFYSEICYNAQCTNPLSELSINGAPNIAFVTLFLKDDNLSGYPSPFSPKGNPGENFITLQYPLATASSVEIDIYDLFGQKVWHRDIDAGQEGGLASDANRVFWEGVNDEGTTVANGGYVVRVKVGATGQIMKTKILVVK